MGSSLRRNPALVKINEEIGRNIHRTRTLLQLTQLDVGHIIDVRPQQIQKYESGKDAISAARLWHRTITASQESDSCPIKHVRVQ